MQHMAGTQDNPNKLLPTRISYSYAAKDKKPSQSQTRNKHTQCGRQSQYEYATSSKIRKFLRKQRQQQKKNTNTRQALPNNPYAFYFANHTYMLYIYMCVDICVIVCNTNLRDL